MKTVEKKPIKKGPGSKDPLKIKLTDHPVDYGVLERSTDTALVDKIIQVKKNRVKRRKQEKILFLGIGLCLSLLLVIGAFEWKVYTTGSGVSLASTTDAFESLVDIPQTEQVVPPTPRVEQAQFIEVPDEEVIEQEIEIDLDVEITEEAIIQEVIVSVPTHAEEEEKADEIFTIVEQQPSPVGGLAAFYSYVGDNLKYPSMATRMNIQGRVFVQFVIEKDGSISDVVAVKGIGAGCDEEAVRVVSGAPKWEPGKQRGRPVRVRMILPIVFKLIE